VDTFQKSAQDVKAGRLRADSAVLALPTAEGNEMMKQLSIADRGVGGLIERLRLTRKLFD